MNNRGSKLKIYVLTIIIHSEWCFTFHAKRKLSKYVQTRGPRLFIKNPTLITHHTIVYSTLLNNTNSIVIKPCKKMSNAYNPQPPMPVHLCFFLIILFMFVGFTWYINYESIFEGLFDQIKLLLMVSPLILLMVVHLLSSLERSLFFLPFPEQDAIHRAGSTPWGVGLLLVLLLFMISYQSDFRERWFPLLSR